MKMSSASLPDMLLNQFSEKNIIVLEREIKRDKKRGKK